MMYVESSASTGASVLQLGGAREEGKGDIRLMGGAAERVLRFDWTGTQDTEERFWRLDFL
jgi:hypothetical protein